MIDFTSPTWRQVTEWANDQLTRARERNDAAGLSEVDTALLRGEIRCLKRLLDLPKAAARVVAADPDE